MLDRLQLKLELEKAKDDFDIIKELVKGQLINIKYSKGPYFETLPFSYQRNGFKQGKLIDNIEKIKTTEDLYSYGYDKDNRLIEVKEGISIENNFYYQFFIYEKEYTKSFFFDNEKALMNISFYYYNNSNKIQKILSQGRRGGREESYFYNESNFIDKIEVKQFDRNGNEANFFCETFIYDDLGNLSSITKSFENNFSEQIYPK